MPDAKHLLICQVCNARFGSTPKLFAGRTDRPQHLKLLKQITYELRRKRHSQGADKTREAGGRRGRSFRVCSLNDLLNSVSLDNAYYLSDFASVQHVGGSAYPLHNGADSLPHVPIKRLSVSKISP